MRINGIVFFRELISSVYSVIPQQIAQKNSLWESTISLQNELDIADKTVYVNAV